MIAKRSAAFPEQKELILTNSSIMDGLSVISVIDVLPSQRSPL
jgi:hypothetical protein